MKPTIRNSVEINLEKSPTETITEKNPITNIIDPKLKYKEPNKSKL